MNDREYQEGSDALRRYTKKVCKSKRSARKYLRNIGIIDKHT